MIHKMDGVVHQIPTDKFHTVGKLLISNFRTRGCQKRQTVRFCVKPQFVTSY